jgi:hypothetical protein
MRCWSRVLILLTVALAALNAQCFAQCLTQPDGSGATHCHQNGQAKSAHCSLQHELRVGSAGSVTPGAVLIDLVELPVLAFDVILLHAVKLFASSPPSPFGGATPLPLRV